MNKQEREARLQRVKKLGRRAYRVLQDGDILGNITIKGELKRVRTFDDGFLFGELTAAHRSSTDPADFSQLQIRADGRKVLDIRWDGSRHFRVLHFEPGDWERTFWRTWLKPIPLD